MENHPLKRIGIFALAMSAQCLTASAWTSECRDKVCQVSVEAMAQNQRFLTFAVLFDRDGSNPAIVMTTPLGTALDAGARFVVGSEELKLVYKVCFPDGCQAVAQLSAEQLAMLKGQATGSARFFAQGNDPAAGGRRRAHRPRGGHERGNEEVAGLFQGKRLEPQLSLKAPLASP